MSVELCNWIGREVKDKKLSEELMGLMSGNAPLHTFVGHILASCGYATSKEIKHIMAVIATFENKTEAECRKMRADRLMDNNRLVDAIYEYESILDSDAVRTMTRPFIGDVHHNLGCAYAKLFFFDEAINHFDEAYKCNKKINSAIALLYAAKCKKDQPLFDSYVQKFLIPKEVVEDVNITIKTITGRDVIVDFDLALDDMSSLADNQQQYQKQLADIIDGWKAGYNSLCKI